MNKCVTLFLYLLVCAMVMVSFSLFGFNPVLSSAGSGHEASEIPCAFENDEGPNTAQGKPGPRSAPFIRIDSPLSNAHVASNFTAVGGSNQVSSVSGYLDNGMGGKILGQTTGFDKTTGDWQITFSNVPNGSYRLVVNGNKAGVSDLEDPILVP